MQGNKVHPSPAAAESKDEQKSQAIATIPTAPASAGSIEGVMQLLHTNSVVGDSDELALFIGWLREHPQALVQEDMFAKGGLVEAGQTLLHVIVENAQYKAFKAIMNEIKENDKIAINPVQADDKGLTPLRLACEKQNNRIVQKIMNYLKAELKWMTAMDLIGLAKTFPTLIAQYFDDLQFAPPFNDPDKVSQDCKRYPMPDGQDFVVLGSNEEDTHVKGLWNNRAAQAREMNSKGFFGRMMVHAKTYNFGAMLSGAVGEEVAVEARCIGIENITGPIIRPRDNVLRALYKCGEDDIMGTNVMRAVLDWKWQKFAGGDYRFTFMLYWIYVLLFMVAMSDFFVGPAIDTNTWEINEKTHVFVEHVLLLLMSIYYLITELLQMKRAGFTGYFGEGGGLYNFMELLCFIFVIAALLLHVQQMELSKVFASFAALQVWTNAFLRMRCFMSTGPFIRMVIEIVKDMQYFMLLLTITLIAFAQAYYIIIEKTVPLDPDSDNQFQTLTESFFLAFIMMLGEFADTLAYFDNGTSTQFPWFAKVIFVLFCFICMIVLLNLLIAIMGETYSRIMEDGVEDDWRMEQAGVIVSIENDMSPEDKKDPNLFPRWLHVLMPSDSKDEEDSEVLVEKLQEMLSDVREMVYFHMKDAKKMQKEFDEKIETLVVETAKMRKMRLEFKTQVVDKIEQIEEIVQSNTDEGKH